MDWGDLVQFHNDNVLTDGREGLNVTIPRKESVKQAYIAFIGELREKNILLDDYLWEIVLKKSEEPQLRSNDFPYDFVPSIDHYVLWLPFSQSSVDYPHNCTMSPSDCEKLIKRNLKRLLNVPFIELVMGVNLLWFKNSTHTKSVQSIEHLHVFFRSSC